MKRARYREAVYWIAMNDSAGDDDALDPQEVAKLVTATLIADLFDLDPLKVGQDIVAVRRREFAKPPPQPEAHATR